MNSSQYHQLADHKYIDKVGTKSTYKPKGLDIKWGKDKRYWKIDNNAAELLQVSWLEVTGVEKGLKPNKTYKISFEISLEPHAFGWEGIKIYVLAKVVGQGGKYSGKPFSLPDNENKVTFSHTVKTTTEDSKKLTLNFGLYEVFSGVWKGGLKIYNATVEEV